MQHFTELNKTVLASSDRHIPVSQFRLTEGFLCWSLRSGTAKLRHVTVNVRAVSVESEQRQGKMTLL